MPSTSTTTNDLLNKSDNSIQKTDSSVLTFNPLETDISKQVEL